MSTNLDKPRAKMVKLKGRGAAIKALIPALLSVWKQHYMVGSVQQHEEIALALECSVRIDDILDERKTDFKLPGPVAAEFETNIRFPDHAEFIGRAFFWLGGDAI